jgi:hypothetical protein
MLVGLVMHLRATVYFGGAIRDYAQREGVCNGTT